MLSGTFGVQGLGSKLYQNEEASIRIAQEMGPDPTRA